MASSHCGIAYIAAPLASFAHANPFTVHIAKIGVDQIVTNLASPPAFLVFRFLENKPSRAAER